MRRKGNRTVECKRMLSRVTPTLSRDGGIQFVSTLPARTAPIYYCYDWLLSAGVSTDGWYNSLLVWLLGASSS